MVNSKLLKNMRFIFGILRHSVWNLWERVQAILVQYLAAVMSIIKDKHIEEGKLSNVYVKHEYSTKVDFYQKIAIKMLDKLKIKWTASIDKDKKNKNVLVISKIKNKG
jgi:hypothetical protein